MRTTFPPALGAPLEMNVLLPQPARDIRAAEIHAKGQVTRSDHRQGVCGFAAMNRTVFIRESIEHAFEGKKSAERGSRVA